MVPGLKWGLTFAAAMMWVFWTGEALALNRAALVIGNAKYLNEHPLVNPERDAKAVAAALRAAGFESVTLLVDADVATFSRALKKFHDQTRDVDVAVLYYAGHGMEMDGVNYLIPVDASLKTDRDLSSQAIDLPLAQEAAAGAKLLDLVVLDACRDNPFASRMLGSGSGQRSMSRGLAPIREDRMSANSIVEYSAESGTTASDGDPSAGNSPFAAAFVNHVTEPGLEVTLLFGKIRDEVEAATQRQQHPHAYSSHGPDPVFLVPPDPRRAGPPVHFTGAPLIFYPAGYVKETFPQHPAVSPMLVAWQGVIGSADTEAIRTYIRKYPQSPYALAAVARLQDLLGAKHPAGEIFDTLARAHDLMDAGDYPGAERLYAEAAATGSAAAEFGLATFYDRRKGASVDAAKAVKLYRAAADQNYAPAQYALALELLRSGGVAPPDYATATALLEKAAKAGLAEAANALADFYAGGTGVAKNLPKADGLYRSAAEAGSADAISTIGVRYAQGRGVAQDFALAAEWQQMAADRGSVEAQALLGLAYFEGRGVARDGVKARLLMNKAAAQGNLRAIAWMKLNPSETSSS